MEGNVVQIMKDETGKLAYRNFTSGDTKTGIRRVEVFLDTEMVAEIESGVLLVHGRNYVYFDHIMRLFINPEGKTYSSDELSRIVDSIMKDGEYYINPRAYVQYSPIFSMEEP